MKNNSPIFKYVILFFILGVLFLPLIQKSLSVFKLKPLKGSVIYPEKVSFDVNDWLTAKYQEEKESYLNEMFGFRSTCIRINNQIAYSFFNYAKANGVIIGKENYLYEESYINAYTGKDFVSQDSIDHILNRLNYLKEILKNNNKHLLVVLAPGKANIYPEYIPDKYMENKGSNRNYTALLLGIKAGGLNVIDFNSWFLDNKNKSKYPLFTKYGIHWTAYGAAFAADSIIKKVESITSIDMPDFSHNDSRVEESDDQHYDIAEGMNLFKEFPKVDLCYPRLNITNIEKNKPSILVISDSFFWGIYSDEFSHCFKENHFWYYNKQVYPDEGRNLTTDGLNTADEILKHDVVMILITEANLKNFGWGFLERAEKDLKNKGNILPDYSVLMKRWRAHIRMNEKWMLNVRKMAKDRNVSIDSMISLEADWQIKHL